MNKAGLAAVEAVLKDARRMARNMPQAKKAAIEKMCAEIDELAKELAALQASGKVRGLLEVHMDGGEGLFQGIIYNYILLSEHVHSFFPAPLGGVSGWVSTT